MPFPTHIVAAAGYVLDRRGNILLVKTFYRAGWEPPGGQVEEGETIEQGVIREIREESGIVASVRSLALVTQNLSSYTYRDGVTKVHPKVMFDFLCDYLEGEPTPSEETGEVRWVPLAEAEGYFKQPAVLERFQQVMAFGGRVRYQTYRTKPAYKLLSRREL